MVEFGPVANLQKKKKKTSVNKFQSLFRGETMEAPPAQDLLEEIFGSEWSGGHGHGGRTRKMEPAGVTAPAPGCAGGVGPGPVGGSESCFSPQAPSSLSGRCGEETSSVTDQDQDQNNEALVSGEDHETSGGGGKSLPDFAADTTTPPPRRNSNNSIRGDCLPPPPHHPGRCLLFQLFIS